METTQPTMEQPPAAPTPKTSLGAIIGLLVVVAALVLGALYFLNERIGKVPATEEGLSEQGTSTEPAAIEEDLSAESPDDFDKDLDAAYVELDAALEEQPQ